jgi:N-methylhydantoinase B
MDCSETMMRAALRALPDGEAEFTDIFDGDGVITPGETEDETFKVRIKVTKCGDTITADFAGSDTAVAGPMNAPLTVTASGVFCALKMIVDSKSLIPPNSGCWRPVTVTAPPGSVVNAQHPSPVVYANHEISHGDGGAVRDHATHCDGGIAGDLGGHHPRRDRLSDRRSLRQL